jgi:Lrp/AsnC family leucine-responsive transcriptional regulator
MAAKLDSFDLKILAELQANGGLSNQELADRVGLSASPCSRRVHQLEESGVIEGYTIRLKPGAGGLPLAVHMRLRPMPGELPRVAALLQETPEVVEAERVTGDDCFVARAFVRGVEELESLIDRFLPYAATNTAIIQSSPVKRRMPRLPLDEGD